MWSSNGGRSGLSFDQIGKSVKTVMFGLRTGFPCGAGMENIENYLGGNKKVFAFE